MKTKKFVNHVDHVTYISWPHTIQENLAQLSALSGATFTRFDRHDMGFTMYLSWEAGLEVVTPMEGSTDFNQLLYGWLEERGEGLMGVVFGIRDLEQHRQRLEAQGFEVGPVMDDHADSPWHHKIRLFERLGGVVMNSTFILGDIDYSEGMIRFEDS